MFWRGSKSCLPQVGTWRSYGPNSACRIVTRHVRTTAFTRNAAFSSNSIVVSVANPSKPQVELLRVTRTSQRTVSRLSRGSGERAVIVSGAETLSRLKNVATLEDCKAAGKNDSGAGSVTNQSSYLMLLSPANKPGR